MKKTGDIWIAVLDGSTSAWRKLVLKYATLVYSVACRSGLTADDAEDCSQQTWLTLYRRRHSIEDPGRLPAWLIVTTRRIALRMIRRQGTIIRTERNAGPPAASSHPDEDLMQLQRSAQLQYAIEQLDDRCRQLLNALFWADSKMSYKDIAREFGIPANSLGPTRSRCLRKLKQILTEIDYT